MYSEFVGITQEVANLIERRRTKTTETKNDILLRVLSNQTQPDTKNSLQSDTYFDLGQGAKLRVGEKIYLFLDEGAKRSNDPHAIADVKKDGIYLNGKRVEPSHGSVIQPAMRKVQEKLGHRNEKGEIKSLSAWRQWNVIRDGRLKTLFELKDPELARTRGRSIGRLR